VAIDRNIVLSGALSVGKTTLAQSLVHEHHLVLISARGVIRSLYPGALTSRSSLQAAGASLENSSPGAWLADAVIAVAREDRPVVVDSVRTQAQARAVRAVLSAASVHMHLYADRATRRVRHGTRSEVDLAEASDFDSAEQSETSEDDALRAMSDVAIETTMMSADDVFRAVMSALGRPYDRN
jgi:cytidylate kinase